VRKREKKIRDVIANGWMGKMVSTLRKSQLLSLKKTPSTLFSKMWEKGDSFGL